MRHLAGDHVHFIGEGDRDQHVRVADAGARQDVRMRGMADERLHVERIVDLTDQFRRLVDDGHVVLFAGKIPRDMEADLAGAANHNLHRKIAPTPTMAVGYSLADRITFCTPRPFSLRCKAARSISTNSAVRLILPPKRVR